MLHVSQFCCGIMQDLIKKWRCLLERELIRGCQSIKCSAHNVPWCEYHHVRPALKPSSPVVYLMIVQKPGTVSG